MLAATNSAATRLETRALDSPRGTLPPCAMSKTVHFPCVYFLEREPSGKHAPERAPSTRRWDRCGASEAGADNPMNSASLNDSIEDARFQS